MNNIVISNFVFQSLTLQYSTVLFNAFSFRDTDFYQGKYKYKNNKFDAAI